MFSSAITRIASLVVMTSFLFPDCWASAVAVHRFSQMATATFRTAGPIYRAISSAPARAAEYTLLMPPASAGKDELAADFKNRPAERRKAGIENFSIISPQPAGENCLAQALEKGQYARIPTYFANVTAQASAYRTNCHVLDTIVVSMHIDRSKMPAGTEWHETGVYYYARASGRWQKAALLALDIDSALLTAEVPSNTDYFAGLIRTPDMPEAAAFLPTGISDLEAANPAEGMQLISPPEISRTGEARLSYPLKLPPGRSGMTPSLSLNYNSDGGSGWCGYGWSIDVPSVSIDTRWGVPQFSGVTETEVYLINGESLAMEGGRKANRPVLNEDQTAASATPRTSNSSTRFFPRLLRSYREIDRLGNTPKTYCWTETTADQRTYYYGTSNGLIVDPAAVMTDEDGNIIRWYLRKVEDKWGNTISYNYHQSTLAVEGKLSDGGKRMYLESITYTGDANSSGAYSVTFVPAEEPRGDARISLKSGVKEVDDWELEEIVIRYQSDEVRTYRLKYADGDFFKRLLTSVGEYRDDQLFYEHEFDYYSEALTFGPAQRLSPDDRRINLFKLMPDVLEALADPLNLIEAPSPIKTTVTHGFSAGGGVGLGVGPGSVGTFSKTFTFSGRLGLSVNRSTDIIQMLDVSGDGLPDMVYNDLFGDYHYRAMYRKANGELGFKPHRDLSFPDKLMRNVSVGFNYGFDFVLPQSLYYFGMNWNQQRSTTSNYLMDYNADGFPDVITQGSVPRVLFGQPAANGNYYFAKHSKATPNPVIKGKMPISLPESEPLMDFELVRSWTAPTDGMVDISGTAKIAQGLSGQVRVAIQRNGDYLGAGFITVDPSSPKNMSENDVVVSAGDKLLFRTRSGEDGHQDLLLWNPQVNYTSPTPDPDPNGIDYAHSDYEQAFLLSGSQGVVVEEGEEIKVGWGHFNVSALSDDVVLRIAVQYEDGTVQHYDNILPFGNAHSPALADFTLSTGGTADQFLGQYDALSQLPVDEKAVLSFHVLSCSDVDWKDIDWRPEVELRTRTCAAKKIVYPLVDYQSFGQLIQWKGAQSIPGNLNSSSDLRVWPKFSHLPSDLEQIFSNEELNSADPQYRIALLTVKSGSGLLSKLGVQLSSQNQLSFFELEADGELGSSIQRNAAAHRNGFRAGQVVNNEIYLSWNCNNAAMAEFIRQFASLELLELAPTPVVLQSQLPAVNIKHKDFSPLQEKLLGWGHFAWNVSEDAAIPPIAMNELVIANQQIAEENDYSETTEIDSESFESNLGQESIDALNPLNQRFLYLGAIRGEYSQALRDYETQYHASSSVASLDRYSVYGTHSGLLAFDGAMSPAKFGEEEPIPASPANGEENLFGANGALQVQKSLSQAKSHGPRIPRSDPADGKSVSMVASSTAKNNSKYISRNLSQFIDLNGDRYADHLVEDDGLKLSLTNPWGGLAVESHFPQYQHANKSVTNNKGLVVSGNFINEDARFNPTGGNASANFGDNQSLITLQDINGDGLMDRLEWGSTHKVYLNNGHGFLPPIVSPLHGVPQSKNKSFGVGLSLSPLKTDKSTEGKSFEVGVGINKVLTQTEATFIDLNGDGLADKVESYGNDLLVFINTGSGFKGHPNLPEVDLSRSGATGLSARAGGTIGITVFSILAAHLKLSLSLDGQGNFSVNRSHSDFRDMTGDGVPDYVTQDEGELIIHPALLGKSNRLKRVDNPLGGSFEIDYKRVGNRYGPHPSEVLLHHSVNELMLWDMPSSRWVMSDLILRDGYDVVETAEDLDGEDEIRYRFAYDGGLESRREREFLGFTRIEKLMPTVPNELPEKQSGTQTYLSEVTEYTRAKSNAPGYRKRFEYLKGIVHNSYQLHHEIIRDCQHIEEQEPICEDEHIIKLMQHDHYDYEFRYVGMDRGDPDNFSRVISTGPESWPKVDWRLAGETESLFPALLAHSTVKVPQIAEASKVQFLKYNYKYDQYTNVVEYGNDAVLDLGDKEEVIVDTIFHHHFEYRRQLFTMSDYWNAAGIFANEPSFVDPQSGFHCYIVPYFEDPSFSADTLCINPYLLTDPCNFYTPPLGGDQDTMSTVHRRKALQTSYVIEERYDPDLYVRALAKMSYFPPTEAAGQTNMLQSHRIYLDEVSAAGLTRHTEVPELASGKAPAAIVNYRAPNDGVQTNLAYDQWGNLLQITAPPNHQGQAMQVNFQYDAQLHQYLEKVENSYGESICNRYDFKQGQLLQTIDINGHPMRYTYDEFHRLKEVWAPRELNDASSSATISYQYFPGGQGELGVPVAITNHNLSHIPDPTYTVPALTEANCDNLGVIDLSGRNAITNPLQTATFVDGLQRVVQVKQDASHKDGPSLIHREVSGFTQYDLVGRAKISYLSFAENLSEPIAELAIAEEIKSSERNYDYAGRVLEDKALNGYDGAPKFYRTTHQYQWSNAAGEEAFSHYQTTDDGVEQRSIYNEFGQTIAQITSAAITRFEYDALDQLLSSSDPLEVSTSYQYNRLGQLTEEQHQDRGTSQFLYDDAGNLISTTYLVHTDDPYVINLSYHFNRLVQKSYPFSAAVNDVEYVYGTKNDERNGAGRVVKFIKGSDFMSEHYRYDELGNVIREYKVFHVPQVGQQNFLTRYGYDSWGRLHWMYYPDNELLRYSYNQAGDLIKLTAEFSNAAARDIVSEIKYAGFGNIKSIEYGNGVKTSYGYEDKTRRLKAVSIPGIMDKSISYTARGNVGGIANQLTNPGPDLGGDYQMLYTYDAHNRLKTAEGSFDGYLSGYQHDDYELSMTYNDAGGIEQKDQRDRDANGQPWPATDYLLNYQYDPLKKHRLTEVSHYQQHSNFYEYNEAGSISGIYQMLPQDCPPEDPCPPYLKEYQSRFWWNEDQQLAGVENSNGIHHYLYDHKGERVMKSSVAKVSLESSPQSGSFSFLYPYQLYVNPYLVATHYDQAVDATKHYYMGSQRLASTLISYAHSSSTTGGEDPPLEGAGGEGGEGSGPSAPEPFYRNVTPHPPGTSLGAVSDLQQLLAYFGYNEGSDYQLNELLEPEDYSQSPFAGGNYDETPVSYWYHPDYLGNTEFITDEIGDPFQYFFYSPWGESLVSQHAHTGLYDSPYRFNAKEYDPETGNYYYGARYYDPKVSVWLSVDPLAEKYPRWSPYVFTGDNPTNLVDLDGRWVPGLDDDGNVTYTAEKGDSPSTMADQYGLTQTQAELITGQSGNTPISRGTQIQGCQVYEATGNEVLKLDLRSEGLTDADIAHQLAFAISNERRLDKEDGNLNDYYSRIEEVAIRGAGSHSHGIVTDHNNPVEVNIDGDKMRISLSIGTHMDEHFSPWSNGSNSLRNGREKYEYLHPNAYKPGAKRVNLPVFTIYEHP